MLLRTDLSVGESPDYDGHCQPESGQLVADTDQARERGHGVDHRAEAGDEAH